MLCLCFSNGCVAVISAKAGYLAMLYYTTGQILVPICYYLYLYIKAKMENK